MVRNKMRFLVLALCGGLTALGLQVATAGPAAAIPGLQNVSAASPVDSSVSKSVVATCPAGKQVVGGGGQLTVITGEASITRLAPTATADGYEARAYEDADGFAGNWGLIVTAVCANPPPGYEIQTAVSPVGSPATANVTATCSSGHQVLGTGGAVSRGHGSVVLTGFLPAPITGPNTVLALGAEVQGGTTNSWTVTAWAICANVVPGYKVEATTSVIDSTTPKAHSTPCPAGSFVHGVGFLFTAIGIGEFFLNAIFPNPPAPLGTDVPLVAAEDQSGMAGNWGMRVYAICAT